MGREKEVSKEGRKDNPIEKWSKGMKRHYSEEYPQMTNKLMKKIISSVIREIQNKTRYHFTATSDF